MAAKDTPEVPMWPTNPDPSKDHVYAIGRLSVKYNDLESVLLSMIHIYDRHSDSLRAFLFEKVPTNVRIEWLKKAMALYECDPDVHSAIEHFISAYAICTYNRGLLVHSRIMGIRTDENSLIATKRTRKSGETSVYEFPIEVIRRVADEVDFWRGYGGHICAYLSRRDLIQNPPKGITPVGPATLPQKSSLPLNLMANSPGKGKKPPRQPQS